MNVAAYCYNYLYKGLFTYYVIIFLNSKMEFCDRRSPQLVVAIGHNIFEVTEPHIRDWRSPQLLVPEGHKELWRPLTANRGFCDFEDGVAYGHNQL